MKPRTLHLLDSFNQGGSERQALDLVRLLHASGKYEVLLASLSPNGVLRADAESLGLGEIPSFPLTSFHNLNTLVQLRRFVRHLRSQKITLLQTTDFYTNIFGMTAGLLAGVPVRVASRRETSGMRTVVQTQLQKAAYAFAHQVIANSESVRRKLLDEGIRDERISVIHSSLDLDRVMVQPNLSRGAILSSLGIVSPDTAKPVPGKFVTIVANMRHEVKDYPMFLRMAQRVARVVPDVGFLLAGEGDLQQSLQQMAAEFGIGSKTFFLGRCENVAQLLSVSEVCVLSSKAEGFSNSILEYMAAGCPVVATDVGGASEAIVEGETGHIVPSGNDRTMASMVVSLLRDPEKAKSMGERGRKIVEEKFSSRTLLEKTDALYEELLELHVGSTDRERRPRTGMVNVSQPAGASPPSRP